MKQSLISRIESYAKKNPFWISGGAYERLALEAGYKASNCSRRLRELHTAGILERREVKGHVEYRYKEPFIFDSENWHQVTIARKEPNPTPSESREESKQIALQI